MPNKTGFSGCRILSSVFRLIGLAVFLSHCGCGNVPGVPLPAEVVVPVDSTFELVARFSHISDAQIVDEESPGRLTSLAALSASAWRPQEAYSIHLLDGMVRTINKIHVAEQEIDFVIHTGDACDNAQWNELDWFMTAMDGGLINPLTGPDDRDAAQVPEPLLDPHRPFEAQGLYRMGVHGERPTIPWYSVIGNHDRFAVGVFPILPDLFGFRAAPLPLNNRLGLFLPLVLNPVGAISWAPISPANPGPPRQLSVAQAVTPNPEREFFSNSEFIAAHVASATEPKGHGFNAALPNQTWHSAEPMPGLRLISLNTADPMFALSGTLHFEGAISLPQIAFLIEELEEAEENGEIVVVASHHPSTSITPGDGSAISAGAFVDLLNRYPSVKLHIAGHLHHESAIDRGGYVEIVTGSTLDPPQRGRIIEIWRRADEISLRYRFFSHLDEVAPPSETDAGDLFIDPFLPIRQIASELAGEHGT